MAETGQKGQTEAQRQKPLHCTHPFSVVFFSPLFYRRPAIGASYRAETRGEKPATTARSPALSGGA